MHDIYLQLICTALARCLITALDFNIKFYAYASAIHDLLVSYKYCFNS